MVDKELTINPDGTYANFQPVAADLDEKTAPPSAPSSPDFIGQTMAESYIDNPFAGVTPRSAVANLGRYGLPIAAAASGAGLPLTAAAGGLGEMWYQEIMQLDFSPGYGETTEDAVERHMHNLFEGMKSSALDVATMKAAPHVKRLLWDQGIAKAGTALYRRFVLPSGIPEYALKAQEMLYDFGQKTGDILALTGKALHGFTPGKNIKLWLENSLRSAIFGGKFWSKVDTRNVEGFTEIFK